MSNERLKEIIDRLLDFEINGQTELWYVRYLIKDVAGCTKAEIEELGYDWLFEEEE